MKTLLLVVALVALAGCQQTYSVVEETEVMAFEEASPGARNALKPTGEITTKVIESKLDRAACELVVKSHEKKREEQTAQTAVLHSLDRDLIRLGSPPRWRSRCVPIRIGTRLCGTAAGRTEVADREGSPSQDRLRATLPRLRPSPLRGVQSAARVRWSLSSSLLQKPSLCVVRQLPARRQSPPVGVSASLIQASFPVDACPAQAQNSARVLPSGTNYIRCGMSAEIGRDPEEECCCDADPRPPTPHLGALVSGWRRCR